MRTTIASRQKSVLFKISNGICIYREESFGKSAQTKSPLKRPRSVVGIVGVAFSLIFIFFPIFNQPALGSFNYTVASVPDVNLPQQPGLQLPIRLKIPKIHVDAILESVGLTSEGALAVPKDPTNAGWYNLGPRPGENGDSVIDGHFGWWKNGTQGVFNNLNKLHKGDKLYVEDGTGTIITFVVSQSRRFDPNADASDVFSSNDGKAHLNLITCDGTWNNTQKSYSNRLVVFADKETD